MNEAHKMLLSKKLLTALSTVLALLTLAMPVAAVPINVAQGKAVSVTGTVGVISPAGILAGFGDATAFPPAPLSSLVDGISLAEGTYWQAGTVWWDEQNAGSANNIIEIDLGGLFLVSSLLIQADNNENYGIAIRNRFGTWLPFATASTAGTPGMVTRSGGFSPFEVTAFRIDATGGDGFYSVSEFQAMGEAVPEPGTILLLGLGLFGLATTRRCRQ